MVRPAYDPLETYRFKSSAFPFETVAKVAATFDWDVDVTNAPTIGTSTFDPATDTVANVTTVATTTNLTNLPPITTDWLTAAGVSAGAVTKIQSGLSTYDGSDTAGTTTLLSRVVGTIAAGSHVAQTGDSFAYLGTNLGLLGANATEAGGTGDHLTALATAAAVEVIDGIVDRIIVPCAGTTSGAGTGTEVFTYAGITMTATVDEVGERSAVEWGTV